MSDIISTKTIGASTERVIMRRYGDGGIEFKPLLVVNGTTASGNPTITAVASTNGVMAGDPISGTGIPAGATVLSAVLNTSITISANATASATVAITVDKSRNKTGHRTQPRAWVTALFAALNAVN